MKDSTRTPTRVCILPGHLRMSGAVRVMLNLAEGFVERGVEVDIFLTHAPGEFAYLIPPGVSVVVGRGSHVRSLASLVRYLRARRPDALLAAHQADNVMSVVARGIARVPTRVVVTIHNDRSARQDEESLRLNLMTRAMRATYGRANLIVAASIGVADDAARVLGLPRSRIKAIYTATITKRMIEASLMPVTHPWFATSEIPVVLGVGRLTTQKDFPTLVRAFAIVRREMPARLLILGEGKDRAMLEGQVEDLGLGHDVQLPGIVPSAMAYMRHARVLALSSRWEGLGGVLIESLAVGTPVVSTDCPSGPREVLEDGRYGRLVPVGDAEALASAIVETLRNPPPRDELIERGRWFTADRASDEYIVALKGDAPTSSYARTAVRSRSKARAETEY